MINRTVLLGRLTADPELRHTSSDLAVTSFSIAVDRSYVKAGEERQTDFFNIVAWRSTAEFICRYFCKGSLIAIDGKLQSRKYTATDGTNRTVIEVLAENVSFAGERKEQTDSQQNDSSSYMPQPQNNNQLPSTNNQPQQNYTQPQFNGYLGGIEDDDLPF